jgi:hypothetical protein
MNASTKTNSILAIDLGKYKSVACRYAGAEDVQYLSFSTDRERLRKLMARRQPRLEKKGKQPCGTDARIRRLPLTVPRLHRRECSVAGAAEWAK